MDKVVSQTANETAFLKGGGEMGALMRAHDWAATPLGPFENWPERLKAVVETIFAVPQAMWIAWGPELIQIYNDGYRALLDEERHGAALGRAASETWADNWSVAGPMLTGILAGGPAVLHADRREVYRHEGAVRERYFSFSFSPIPDPGASHGVGGVLCVAMETTPAVRLRDNEGRLRELNETLEERVAERTAERNLLARIVETTDAFIQVLDLDFRILAINKACADEFERIYGVRPKVGDTYPELLADRPEELAAVQSFWGRALAGEEFTIVEEFGDPDRVRPCYEIKFNSLRNEKGERIGAYQFVYDVTERLRDQERLRQTEATLRQSQKLDAMGQLTGGVAHDFNNLLTPIIASLDMLLRRGVGSERERRLMDGALQSAERAKVLVQRLLAFARKQPLQPGPVDVRRLVSEMAELIGSTSGPRIDVRVEMHEDLPPALADANQLEMAVLNLAVNARDAMPDAGVLTISAARESVREPHSAKLRLGHYIRLSVRDTGVGMDAPTLARAVEPFFSTKGVGKGTGLGLSMVHGLAEQLGGGLTITSSLGKGTTVDLWLPISAVALEENEDAASATSTPRTQGTALLVDDEDLVRMSTADMLMDLGYEVTEAKSADEAMRLMGEGLAPDLVVTDHLMPGMSGLELARELRTRRPDLPVLIVSGYAEMDGIAPSFARLAKPFRAAEMAASLAALMPDTGL